MTIAEQLKAEGREEGKREGREEGKRANQAEVAMRLIGEGMALDFVAKVTELPLPELRKLKA